MPYKHNKQLVPFAKQLRKEMTREEKHLWYDFLRLYPVRFLRQKVIGNYIADFYCSQAKLVIELDGSQHYTEENVEKDAVRTSFLEEYGLKVIRILNRDVNRNFEGVCAYIDLMVKERLPCAKGAGIALHVGREAAGAVRTERSSPQPRNTASRSVRQCEDD